MKIQPRLCSKHFFEHKRFLDKRSLYYFTLTGSLFFSIFFDFESVADFLFSSNTFTLRLNFNTEAKLHFAYTSKNMTDNATVKN